MDIKTKINIIKDNTNSSIPIKEIEFLVRNFATGIFFS